MAIMQFLKMIWNKFFPQKEDETQKTAPVGCPFAKPGVENPHVENAPKESEGKKV
jgi:hypothetical protein